ncbi:MAG: hypothetical protein Q8M09_10645 [Pseudomonadota bacterium]|nr:hypothetical protein [Pseudomonadota bacterium]MDP1904686.1 hypothetical protein [Pseudomonadota bacterium]
MKPRGQAIPAVLDTPGIPGINANAPVCRPPAILGLETPPISTCWTAMKPGRRASLMSLAR